MYRLKIFYHTGDSFSDEDETAYVEGEWYNLDIITENLKRIVEHNRWYDYTHSGYTHSPKKLDRPEFTDPKYDFNLSLKLDDGTEYMYCAFWCGYFETLYSAEVEEVKTKLPKVTF
jgi:hypothetical protein